MQQVPKWVIQGRFLLSTPMSQSRDKRTIDARLTAKVAAMTDEGMEVPFLHTSSSNLRLRLQSELS